MVMTIERKKARAGQRPKHKRGDLVFLVWADNTCYSRLIEEIPAGVTLDLVAGTWTFEGRTQLIGEQLSNVRSFERGGNPIGVYDRRLLRHLRNMQAMSEWVRTKDGPFGDD